MIDFVSSKPMNITIETATDLPLVWMSILTRTGSASDPRNSEGLVRHAFELARRGTSSRDRGQLDEHLDELGASLDSAVSRDYSGFTGLTLVDNLDAVVEVATDLLSNAAFADDEHAQLARESRSALDELRDDDASVAHRFFSKYVAPGYAYARTSLGTEASLASLDARSAAKMFRQAAQPDNLCIGFAGDITAERGDELARRIAEACSIRADVPAPPKLTPPAARGIRLFVIDKPERTQSQVLLGRVGPAYGTEDFISLVPVETAFGGMFTSRLMQEVRVKRGWSYGASCRLGKGRGPHWLQVGLAPAVDQTAPAIKLVLDMYRELGEAGLGRAELDLTQSYISGQDAFERATPARRMSRAMEPSLLDVDADYVNTFSERVAAVDLESANRAARAWFGDDGLCIVVVTSADAIGADLATLGADEVEIIPYDAY